MPMRRAQSADTAPVDPARAQLIDAARTAWIGRLIDVSRRNNLLFYRPIPTSSIDLTSQNPALLELLAGKAVTGETLLPDLNARTGRVLAIARKAQENSEEKGLQTLYLAVGFASWRSSDGGRAPQAPVFLLPLQMKRKGKELAAIEVQLAGEPQVNPVLLHVLADQSGVQISDEELIQVATPKELEGDSTEEARGATVLNAYQKALYAFEARVKGMPEFRTELSAVISNFSFAKLALVNDLKSAGDRLSSNDAVAAIAGDAQSRGRLGSAQVSIDPRELDAKPPDQDFCVVEADSSQQCAIAGIALGQHAVVHGPPGTGKSQTITNLIASLVANGKRVLFVAEKRAALEVVQQRLEKCSLDHLAMDLHGAELRPKRVMEQVARTLSLVRSAKPVEAEATHRQFQERRSRLNAHDALMHTICERAGKTVYDIQGALLRLPKEARTSVRWRGPELAHLTPLQAEKIRDSFREATPFASLFMREDASPWTGVAFRTGQQVQSAIDLAQRLEHESLPHLNSQTREMEKATGLAAPKDFAEADEVLALLKGVQDQLTRYSIGAFCEDLSGLLTELGKAKGSSVRALWLYWTDASVKAAKRRITELRQGNKIGLADALRELTTLQALQTKWRSLSGGLSSPVAYAGLPSLDRALLSAKNETRDLQQIVNNEGWEKRSLEELAEVVERHAHDSVTPYRMLSLSEIEAKLRDFGVQRLVDDLRQRKCLTGLWVATFDHAWLTSALDEMALKSPEIRSFVGSTHGQYVEEFKQLDTDRLRLGRDRVRRIHAEQTIAAMNAHPDQEALIKQEAAKMRCFKPLRKVFEEAADVMMTVCPCWMASPLSVAQLIHPDLKFDYVIFDEASQILPEDAISAIMRGKYVIVAGDSKQLRFGPILSAGGMRRLNVAVTRARESMTLVSSFAYTDIDTTKVREGTGLEFLRNYLQYAASNGTVFAHGEISNEPMNDFEADIYEALTARGLKLVPQVGCSSFRIDFGVCHPSEPGHFVLAIEADGATYHSSYTARDRDRLRQQMLENLGWRFHRIWSTDWFQRKHEEIERSVGAFDRAVAAAKECRMRLPEERPLEEPVPDLPMQELSGMRSSIFPPIPKRVSISDYTSGELKQLYNWVMSDGQLRTHDEIADEMFAALPFSRRGSRIEAVLRDTIRRCDQTVPRS
jgi:very-short-patch-repair endonuclease